ncbi:hypothetical protein SAMN05216369_1358 [Marinobacter antarcticus]|uniref:Uncharacterized protein n=1 Tax=Marinobacter antarcticus TaxID=564117 RepID=A0A1M6R8B1_9GAMM|nr:hypothetical protein [Marinobacter antarcticus]SHK28666.1 hypothetical protein SAMN05216369_1358 [Marinobacter antarcticus]
MAFSLALAGINYLGGQDLTRWAEQLITQVDLGETLLNGLLSFLLFGGRGREADDRQPWSTVCDVGKNRATPGYVLGAD